ncbi:hypothetical protein [Lactobacillus psittaci]|nr:hypothetical protein [Lactobacillus psittaci]
MVALKQLNKMGLSRAFTLVETVITLGIVCSMMIFTYFSLKDVEEQEVLNTNVNTAIQFIGRASRYSGVNQVALTVKYYESKNELVLVAKNYSRRVALDPRVKLMRFSNIVMGPNGYLSPRTITFATKKYSRQIKMQMMWGKIINGNERVSTG